MTRAQKNANRRLVPCVNCGKVSRRSHDHCATCLGYEPSALTGGRWVLDPVRRIQVWQPEPVAIVETTLTPAALVRRAREDADYDEQTARRAHQAYKRGDRSEWATVGHRVYCRRMWRERASKRGAA